VDLFPDWNAGLTKLITDMAWRRTLGPLPSREEVMQYWSDEGKGDTDFPPRIFSPASEK
jgi:hypothetical protein